MASSFTVIWYFASLHLFFLLSIQFFSAFGLNLSVQENVKCIENEKLALLSFKRGLVDDYDILSSWETRVNNDCCSWRGVQCSNDTDHHIIKLDLHGSSYDDKYLTGEVGSSLTQLSRLNYLDLSSNRFDRIVLEDIGYLTNLSYLDLSDNNFASVIPPHLGNLSKLSVLDLGKNDWLNRDFRWLSGFSSLKHLDLSWLDFHGANDWTSVINKLPMLQSLSLRSCNLAQPHLPPHYSHTNFSRFLVELDLSLNDNLNSSNFYSWLTNFTNLVHLNLASTNLKGLNLDFGNMTSLVFLDLTYTQVNFRSFKSFKSVCNLNSLHLDDNDMEGLLSDFLKVFPPCVLNSLQYLDLSLNKFSGFLSNFTMLPSLKELKLYDNILNGSIPQNLGQLLPNLKSLEVERNSLSGTIPESIGQLSHLEYLDLYGNSLSGTIPQSIGQLSHLECLNLYRNSLSGTIPQNLGQLSSLEYLNFGSNLLEGEVSETHFSKLTHLKNLDLSNNSLNLNFKPDWVPPFQLENILLSSCKLGPLFPKWLQTQNNLFIIDISSAGISDTVPHLFWNNLFLSPNLQDINLSGNKMMGQIPDLFVKFNHMISLESNKFVGRIPSFLFQAAILSLSDNNFSDLSGLCEIVNNSSPLVVLDVSNNKLSGQLPDCWEFLPNLRLLNLSNNYLSGDLPPSMSNLSSLDTLILRNNQFLGALDYLLNLTNLTAIDAMNNRFSGTIPLGVGLNFPNLAFLNLKSNNFHGKLPSSVCNFREIRVLDISSNKVSGSIPTCIHNFSVLKKAADDVYNSIAHYTQDLVMVYKDQERLMTYNVLYRQKSIDLSCNHLTGRIPDEITQLIGLINLNLSNNELTGQIPKSIDQLQSLESLDLSTNRLSGPIPSSLSQISRLPVLNLSYNNLSGKIPTGTQLQSFSNSSYEGNPFLCGDPLKTCFEDITQQQPNIDNNVHDHNEDGDWFVLREFVMSMAFGYIIGFWGIFGTLLLHRRWRHAYFKFLRDICY